MYTDGTVRDVHGRYVTCGGETKSMRIKHPHYHQCHAVGRWAPIRLAVLLLVVFAAPAAIPSAAAADAPNMVSGNGITVSGWRWISPRTLEVDISTAKVAAVAVTGPHRVRVTLPNDYFNTGSTRYSVLYLLHGGAGAN